MLGVNLLGQTGLKAYDRLWGHATGVAATGVLLQRVVDPDLKSRGISVQWYLRFIQ